MRVNSSFEIFVERESAGLLRTAYLLTGDVGHAEDLLQTTLTRVAQRWQQISESPQAYARKVLVNCSRDRIRWLRRRPREAPWPDEVGPAGGGRFATDGGVGQVGDRQGVVQALSRLPARRRQVVVLRFFQDLSVEQTAQVMGCAEGTVRAHTSRALAQLRDLLADLAEAPEPVPGSHSSVPGTHRPRR